MIETNDPKRLSEGYTPGYDIATAYGDPNESSVGITKITFDRLLKLEQPDACIALYAFYCYTGRWQKTEQAHCTEAYAAKALGWSDRTVRRVKARLVAADLVNVVKHVDKATGQVKGWYVRVRHMVRLVIHPDTSGHVDPPGQNSTRTPVSPKCLRTGNENALELISDTDRSRNKSLLQHAQAIYEIYPKKVGRPTALKSIIKAIQKFGFDLLVDKTTAFAAARRDNMEFVPNPATWFNQERFNDNPATWKPNGNGKNGHHVSTIVEDPSDWKEWLTNHPEYHEICRGRKFSGCREFIQREFIADKKKVKA